MQRRFACTCYMSQTCRSTRTRATCAPRAAAGRRDSGRVAHAKCPPLRLRARCFPLENLPSTATDDPCPRATMRACPPAPSSPPPQPWRPLPTFASRRAPRKARRRRAARRALHPAMPASLATSLSISSRRTRGPAKAATVYQSALARGASWKICASGFV